MRKLLFASLFTLLMAPLVAVDTSDATLIGTVTVTNNTGADILNGVAWFEMSAYDLVQAGIIQTDTLDIEIKDQDGNPVPFQPGGGLLPVFGCAVAQGVVVLEETTDCNDAGANDIDFLSTDNGLSVDDNFIVSSNQQFNRIWLNISADSGMATNQWSVIWEYCFSLTCVVGDDATRWAPLQNVVDTSDGFHKAGLQVVTFDMPVVATGREFVGLENYATISWTALHLVRARVTDNGDGAFVTRPSGGQVFVERAVNHIFVVSLAAGESRQYSVFLGQSENQARHAVFGEDAFIETADNAAIEPSNDFEIEFQAFLNVDAPANPSSELIIYKDTSAFGDDLIIRATDDVISVTINGATMSSSATLDDGLFKVRIVNNSGGGELFINDVSVDTQAQQTVPDNAATWKFFQGRLNGTSVTTGPTWYFHYVKVSIPSTTLVIHYELNDLLDESFTNRANPGSHEGELTANNALPKISNSVGASLTNTFRGVFTTPFQTTVALAGSPNASGGADVASDVSGSAEGTGFASLPNPSVNLPGAGFINQIAGEDYDPITAGTQGLPSSFIWTLILGVILIAVALVLLVFTKSLLIVAVAVGAVAMLFVSVNVISPWFLMWLAIPAALWLLAKGGLEF